MRVLHGGHGHIAPLHAGVGTAFNKVNARHTGQTHEVVHGKHHRLFQHCFVAAVHHQAVFVRLNVPPALVVALKMQTTGCDDAKQALQRRKTYARLAHACEAWAFAALQIFLVHARHAIAACGYALAQGFGMVWQIDDVTVVCCVRTLYCHTSHRCGHSRAECSRHKSTPAAVHGFNLALA